MALIINGSQMPVNATVSHNGQSVNKIVYRHICETCGGDGLIGNEPGSDIGMPCEVCGGSGFDVIDTVWEKLSIFTLTITKGIGVESVTVNRTSSRNPDASIGLLLSGAEIYTGDKLTVSAVASSGYNLDPYTTNYTVGENITVNITATIAIMAPIITITSTYNIKTRMRTFTAHFKNPNTQAGTLYYSTDGGSTYTNTSIGANATFSIDVLTVAQGFTGVISLRAYIVISGNSSSITVYEDEVSG